MRLNCVGQSRGTGWWRPPVYGVRLGEGGVHYIPITLSPSMAKRRGRYQGRTSLGREQTQGCLLSWASCVCVCDAKALSHTHTHTHTHTNRQRFSRSIQWTHAAPTRNLSLKVLFILVTGCGSGVILLQYWVTTTTFMPPFKFKSWPNFCCLAPQMGAPALMRQQESCLWR